MTRKFRIWLANMISGGEIESLRDDRLYWIERASERRQGLKEVILCVTPNANATVKRMARIAKEALDATP